MHNYAALIIDLKKSRLYSSYDRNSIQEYIFNVIKVLNKVFGHSIEKEVEFSAGDEVQGLFNSCDAAYLFYRMFNLFVSPVKIRAGIGIGSWDVVVKNIGTTGQDGKAYHNARYAIEHIKDTNGYTVLLYSGKEMDFMVNSLINSEGAIVNANTKNQNEVLLLTELLYPLESNRTIVHIEHEDILKLLKIKEQIDYYKNQRSKKNVKLNLCEVIEFNHFESCPVNVGLDGEEFFVISGKKRGLTAELSTFMRVARQSAEFTIKGAHVYENRNLTISALKCMQMFW